MSTQQAVHRWRKLLRIPDAGGRTPHGGLESIAPPDDPMERVRQAREAMARLIKDRLGGDPALLDAANALALTGEEAVAILNSSPEAVPSGDQFAALEAIVAFDGTRPSFLVKNNQIEFSSSFNTGRWQPDLAPHLDNISFSLSCVGRVELGERHIGSAFLVTPTLAITNRHVAQSIAGFADDRIAIKQDIYLDFGREEWNGKASYDRRKVDAIVFAGSAAITPPIDHKKLDLAVLRVAPSKLQDGTADRHLSISPAKQADYLAASYVAAAGYPANPELYVPGSLKSKYEDVLKRLLEGDGGAKRFAPGAPMSLESSGLGPWTLCHDATTINGNSGSPLLVLGSGAPQAPSLIGLHYGGDWGEQRTNWAHYLHATASATGYGQSTTFGEFCKQEGITL